MSIDNQVLDFIHKRFPNATNSDANWLHGNCYYFAIILKDRFPENSDIYYDVTNGHFVCKIEDYLFDASGIYYKLNKQENSILDSSALNYFIKLEYGITVVRWNKFNRYDSLQQARIERDCLQ